MRRPNNCSIPSCWRTAVGLVWLDGRRADAHVMCELHRAQHEEYAAAEARTHHEELWPERIVEPPRDEPEGQASKPAPKPAPKKAPSPRPKKAPKPRKRSYSETIELVEQLKHLPTEEAAAQAGVAVRTWINWRSRHRARKARKAEPKVESASTLSQLTDDELVELIQSTPKQKRSARLRREAVQRWGELTNLAAAAKVGVHESSWRKWKLQAGWNPKKPGTLPPLPTVPHDEQSLRAMSDQELQALICGTKNTERSDAWRAEAVRRWGHLPNAQAAKLLGMSPRGWRNWVNAARGPEQENQMDDSKNDAEVKRLQEQVAHAKVTERELERERGKVAQLSRERDALRSAAQPEQRPFLEAEGVPLVPLEQAPLGVTQDEAYRMASDRKAAEDRAARLEAEVQELRRHVSKRDRSLDKVIAERDSLRARLDARERSGPLAPDRSQELQRLHAEAGRLTVQLASAQKQAEEARRVAAALHDVLTDLVAKLPAEPVRDALLRRLLVLP